MRASPADAAVLPSPTPNLAPRRLLFGRGYSRHKKGRLRRNPPGPPLPSQHDLVSRTRIGLPKEQLL